MWTLILVLVISTPSKPAAAVAAAIDHISGFDNQEICLAAAAAWREMTTAGTPRALCVRLRS